MRGLLCALFWNIFCCTFGEFPLYFRRISLIYHFVHRKSYILLAQEVCSVLFCGISVINHFSTSKGFLFLVFFEVLSVHFRRISSILKANLINLSFCPQEKLYFACHCEVCSVLFCGISVINHFSTSKGFLFLAFFEVLSVQLRQISCILKANLINLSFCIQEKLYFACSRRLLCDICGILVINHFSTSKGILFLCLFLGAFGTL